MSALAIGAGRSPARWPRSRDLALLAPVLALLAIFFVVPLANLLGYGFIEHRTPRPPAPVQTLDNFRTIFGDLYYWQMLWNSLQLGVYTALLCLLIGYPVAFYLTRCTSWERTIISVACLLPIFVNVIVGILGWYILLLPFGVFQQILSGLGLWSGPLPWLRSFWSIAAVLTYEHLPFAVLILASSLQNVPRDKIDAARMLGASTGRIVRSVVLPLTMPGLVASTILIFSLSVSSYLVPILIAGPRAQVLPLSIFTYASELLNWPMATALALVLLVVVGGLTYGGTVLANRLTRRGQWEMV